MENFDCEFEIKPIDGRQFLQRNFATLPSRAERYSNRRVTINERFSVIERGYVLTPSHRENKQYWKEQKVVMIPIQSKDCEKSKKVKVNVWHTRKSEKSKGGENQQ